MKVTPEHLERIRAAIEATGHDNEEVRDLYRRREIPRGEFVQDLNKRFRWDLYSAAGLPCYNDGDYTDAHIDTALRSIVKPL